MLKNECCLYVIISIHFFSITIYNILIDFPLYKRTKQSVNEHTFAWPYNVTVVTLQNKTLLVPRTQSNWYTKQIRVPFLLLPSSCDNHDKTLNGHL
jgi:hypothetical protein